MTAARYDLTIDQGSDFSLELTVKDSGSAKNLTNWLARSQLRSTKNSASAVASFSSAITSAMEGKLTLSLPYHISDDLTAGLYYYDLALYEEGDSGSTVQVTRIMQGTANLRREVTR